MRLKGLAMPLPAMSGAEPLYRLEEGEFLPDVPRRTHAEAARRGAAQIAQQVSQHVLHDKDVVVFRADHQVVCAGVRIQGFRLDVGVIGGDFQENLAEKRQGAQNIALVPRR